MLKKLIISIIIIIFNVLALNSLDFSGVKTTKNNKLILRDNFNNEVSKVFIWDKSNDLFHKVSFYKLEHGYMIDIKFDYSLSDEYRLKIILKDNKTIFSDDYFYLKDGDETPNVNMDREISNLSRELDKISLLKSEFKKYLFNKDFESIEIYDLNTGEKIYSNDITQLKIHKIRKNMNFLVINKEKRNDEIIINIR